MEQCRSGIKSNVTQVTTTRFCSAETANKDHHQHDISEHVKRDDSWPRRKDESSTYSPMPMNQGPDVARRRLARSRPTSIYSGNRCRPYPSNGSRNQPDSESSLVCLSRQAGERYDWARALWTPQAPRCGASRVAVDEVPKDLAQFSRRVAAAAGMTQLYKSPLLL